MWTIFKVFIGFVTILFLCNVLGFFGPGTGGMWNLSSPTRDQTHMLCIEKQSFNCWTTRENPYLFYILVTHIRFFSKSN